MSYVEHLVASPVVACTWEQVTTPGQEQRVVPDACVDLIWSAEQLRIAGPDTTARVVKLAPGSRLVGVRVRPGAAGVVLARTKRNAMERVRQLTPRTWGGTLVSCIAQINAWLRGWHAFFGIASASEMQMMRKLDAHIRGRLRAIQLRHWKRKRTIARKLVALGVKRESVWRQIYAGRKSWWALSHTHAVDQGLLIVLCPVSSVTPAATAP